MLTYKQGDSVFHRLDPRTKFFWLLVVSVLALLSSSFYYLLIVFTSVFLLLVFLRLPLREIAGFARLFLFFAVFVLVLQGFLYPLGGTALLEFLGGTFTLEGLVFGVGIVFRLFTLVLAVPILVMTTKQKDMIESLGLYLPYEIAFMITTAFRFIPIFQVELGSIVNAQKSRGMEFRGVRQVRAYFAVIVPLLVKALTRAKYLAFSVDARGFGGKRIKIAERLGWLDWLVIGLVLCFAFFCVMVIR